MDTSCLWRALARNVPWATAMVQRSRGTELLVEDNLLDKRTDSPRALFLQRLFVEHGPRLRQIHLSGITTGMMAALFEHLPPTSLQLRSLELGCSLANGRPAFPTGVLRTETLRTLRVQNCEAPWYTLPLPDLSHLKVHNISTRPSLDRLLELLGAPPALTVIDLEDSLPPANDESRKSIELSSLAYLGLSSINNPQEIGNILRKITVPPSATLRLVGSVGQPVTAGQLDPILDEFVGALSTFFGHLVPDLAYGYLHLSRSTWCGFRLKAWRDAQKISETPDLELTIDAVITTSDRQTQDLLQRVFPSLPLSKVTSITLHQFDARRLIDGPLDRLPHLESIKVVGPTTRDFILASLARQAKKNDGTPPAFLPALRFLSIELYSFKGLRDCSIDDLKKCLIARSRQGAQLVRLTLTHCYKLLKEDVESLRQVVDVDWDGIQGFQEGKGVGAERRTNLIVT